jgi:hypothetical protein
MDEPGHGILGAGGRARPCEVLHRAGAGGPSCLLLEGAAGIGKTTLWHAGVSSARARGHRVLSCRAAVSVASPGVLRALAAYGPVVVAIDDVQWLDAPSARVLAFVVRRLEDAPIRILVALRAGPGGDPLDLGQAGPAPSLHRVSIGPLAEEAMTRHLRARTGGDLTRPILPRLHRISEGNPLFALEIARARDDLARVGGPVPPSSELTPTEQRIAELVGAGKENRESPTPCSSP